MAIYFGIAGGSQKGPPSVTIAPGGAAGTAKAPAYGYLGPAKGGANGTFLSPPASPPSPPSPPGPNFTISVTGGPSNVSTPLANGPTTFRTFLTVNNAVTVPGAPPFQIGFGGNNPNQGYFTWGATAVTMTDATHGYADVTITPSAKGSGGYVNILPGATDNNGVFRGYANGGSGANVINVAIT